MPSASESIALLLGVLGGVGLGGCRPIPAPATPPSAERAPPAPWRWTIRDALPGVRFTNPTFAVMPPRGPTHWYVGEREGRIVRLEAGPERRRPLPILDLRGQTLGWQDVGLLNMVFHPDFGRPDSPNRGYIYVWYNHTDRPHPGPDHPRHDHPSWARLSRFTVSGASGLADPASEQVLLQQARTNTDHMGGGMFFHPRDGCLYLALGDGGRDLVGEAGGSSLRSTDETQRIDGGFFSGVLRLDVDRRGPGFSHPIRRQPRQGASAGYFIPDDNPWLDPAGGRLEEFFAIGFRNPHRMVYDEGSRRIFLADVGDTRHEEIDVVERSGNYGWDDLEGSRRRRERPAPALGRLVAPLHTFRGGKHSAVIGGPVYRGSAHPELAGRYLFGDNGSGQIFALDPDRPGQPIELARLPGEMVAYGGLSSFAVDRQGELHLLILGDNQRGTGSLQRLVPPPPGSRPPSRLSETGVFSDLARLEPSPGFFAYRVNAPFWSDHASKHRWLAVPPGTRIGFSERGEWRFPPGTTAIKHFEIPLDEGRPDRTLLLETRLLTLRPDGTVAGQSYRWRPDRSDADLVESRTSEHLTTDSTRWGPLSIRSEGAGGWGSEPLTADGLLHLEAPAGGTACAGLLERSDFDLAARWEPGSPGWSGFVFRGRGRNAALLWRESSEAGRRELQLLPAGPLETTDRSAAPEERWLRVRRSGRHLAFFVGQDGHRWRRLRQSAFVEGEVRVEVAARGEHGLASAFTTVPRRLLVRDHVYPAEGDCQGCHLRAAGSFLGVSTRQWNRAGSGGTAQGNQITAAVQAGLLDRAPPGAVLARLSRLSDRDALGAGAADKARSYLDANCSFCHRPGVVVQVGFDARYETPLERQGLVFGRRRWPVVPDPRKFLLLPGEPERSEVYTRVASRAMPPLGIGLVDEVGAALLRDWITEIGLPSEPRGTAAGDCRILRPGPVGDLAEPGSGQQ